MKSGEVPFKLGDPFSQPPLKFVIRGEDDSARSRLFRFFLFPGIVHEIVMRFRFFFVSSLFHYLAGVPPTPSLPLSRHARFSWIASKKSTRMAVLFVKGNVFVAYYPGSDAAAATSSLLRRRGESEGRAARRGAAGAR